MKIRRRPVRVISRRLIQEWREREVATMPHLHFRFVWYCAKLVVALLALFLVLILAQGVRASSNPTAKLVSNTKSGFAPLRILLRAKLEGGDETEEFYCPAVEWEWPNGTRSTEESDCPPYAERTEYPRVWSRWIVAGCSSEHGHLFTVRFLHGNRLLAQATERVYVSGCE